MPINRIMSPKLLAALTAPAIYSSVAWADRYGIDEAMSENGGSISDAAWGLLLIAFIYFLWVKRRDALPRTDATQAAITPTLPPKNGIPWIPIFIGVALAALASPLGALIFMGVYFWLRPRIGLPKTILALIAVFAGCVAIVVFIPVFAPKNTPQADQGQRAQPNPTSAAMTGTARILTDEELGIQQQAGAVGPAKPSEIDAILKDPPSYQPPPTSPTPAPAQSSYETPLEKHYRRIYAAHPDADALVTSQEFKNWLSFRPIDQQILHNGTTQEIITMLTQFKRRNDCAPPNQLPECGAVANARR